MLCEKIVSQRNIEEVLFVRVSLNFSENYSNVCASTLQIRTLGRARLIFSFSMKSGDGRVILARGANLLSHGNEI